MQAAKKDTRQKSLVVVKVARSVSFNLERLNADKKKISKERERYIESISARALTALGV